MIHKRMIILFISFFLLTGCGSMRKAGVKVSEEELKNVKAGRKIAANYLQVWPMQSGFIKASLGPRINMLPMQAIDAMRELDELAAKSEHTDEEMGYSLGLRARMLSETVMEVIKIFAPDVISFITDLAI